MCTEASQGTPISTAQKPEEKFVRTNVTNDGIKVEFVSKVLGEIRARVKASALVASTTMTAAQKATAGKQVGRAGRTFGRRSTPRSFNSERRRVEEVVRRINEVVRRTEKIIKRGRNMGPEGASPMSTGKNNVPTTDMYCPRKSDRKLACKVWEASGRAIAKMGKKRAYSYGVLHY